MKVLISTDWYKPAVNGVVTSLVNLADGLTASGHEIRILTLSGSRHSHKEGNVTYVSSVGVGKLYPNARLKVAPSSRYIKELIEWKPDIVHSQCEFSTFFLARKIAESCGCPLVHSYHTVYEDFTHYFSPSVRVGKYMATVFTRHILSQVQAVIVPTEKIKTLLEGYGVETPITAIPSGLELEQFCTRLSSAERRARRAGFGFGEEDRVLLYLGRLAKEKHISEILRFLSHIRDASVKLLLVGDGPYRSRLEDEARALGLNGRAVFAGMVDPSEVVRYYSLGDIFVTASKSETQGLTYVEAMAAGLPLLCCDDPCLNDLIISGVNGLTYKDEEEFHYMLELLCSDKELCRLLGEAARETAFQRYSIKGFADCAEAVYRGLII